MVKYKRLQILRHALEYYIQRPDATSDEIKIETSLLKQLTNEVNQLKEDKHIVSLNYKVTHVMGDVWELECSSEKSAKRRAFRYYKKECSFAKYDEFLSNVKVKKIENK
ncbi:MAG: hypothetical protein RSD26_12475 [Cellulosilyticaceae bacterium]